MIGVLLALQLALPPACTSSPLCRLLEAAAAANQARGRGAPGYRAVVETESATLSRWEGRVEGAAILEQVSSTVEWSGDGVFHQHLTGWHSSTNAIPLTRLATIGIGWLVPAMNGERLALIPRHGTVEAGVESLSGSLTLPKVEHPLASDRDSFYRFAGGTEVLRHVDGATRRVLAIEVTPVSGAPDTAVLFEGEMDLDPETRGLVRLFGRFKAVARARRGLLSQSQFSEPAATLVDLVNQQLPDGSWVPLVQRFEIETISSRTWGFGSALRIISCFHDVKALPRSQISEAGGATITGYSLSSAPPDSLRRFSAWRAAAGSMTKSVVGDDFARFRSARLQPAGRPVVTVQGYFPGEFLRINKVEGIFTGASLLLRLRDAAPGVGFHVTGGYAWAEKTVRGRAGVGWRIGPWSIEGGVARTLDVTNKFRDQFDNPILGGLVGRDNWDYLQRQGAGLFVTRLLGRAGSLARVDAAAIEDRALIRHMTKSLSGSRLRDNRGIWEGSYFRTRALLDWNPEVSPGFARNGIGFRGEVEHAGGELDYTRVEARVVGRASVNRVSLFTRLHAGAVFANRPPPQQLFEMGGPAGLPGYNYKEFAGDRAMLFRTRVTYALPLLDTRRQLRSGATLPALAPAISIGFNAAIADVRTAGGAAAVAGLGAVPASVAGGTVHPSIDVRLGIFGDALGVGLARALEPGRKAQFIFAFGRQF